MARTDPLSLAGLWGMSASQASGLGRHARSLQARRGEIIAHRGAPLAGVYIVASGTLKLSLRMADGEERVLRVVSALDSFGEPAALLGRPCQYDACALSEVRYVVVRAHAILALMENDRRFARQLVMALAGRSFGILQEFAAATTLRSAQRLASYLESLALEQDRPRVQLPVTKTVLAALLGMQKETLSRLLHQFAADGVIGVMGREIAILDTRKLREITSSAGSFPAPGPR